MRKVFFFVFFVFCTTRFVGQNRLTYLSYIFPSDSLQGFNEINANNRALRSGFFGLEYKVFMYRAKRDFINKKYGYTQPSGFNKISAPPIINSAPCLNEDFEASPVGPVATLAGWIITEGQNTTSCTKAGCCSAVATGTNTWIRNTPYNAVMPIGIVPNSPLGGNKVIQLNDEIVGTGEAVVLEQSFPVTASNSLLQCAYFCAMNGTGHQCCINPYFNITIFDCTNTIIPSETVNLIAPGISCTSSSIPNWVLNPSGLSYHTSWQVKSIDLSPYIGTCIRLQVTVADCSAYGHAGFCFFDAKCSQFGVKINDSTFTPSGNITICADTATLSAPIGISSSVWDGPVGSGITSNTNTAVTTTVSGTYTLTTSTGTNTSVNIFSLTLLPLPSVSLTVSSTTICVSGPTIALNGSPSGGVYSGAGVSGNVFTPLSVAGNYTVGYTVTSSLNSCTNISTQNIFVDGGPPAPLGISGYNIFCSGPTTMGYSVVPVPGGTSYNWTLPSGWSGTSTTSSILAFPNNTGGNVTVSITNSCGTSPIVVKSVTIDPSPTVSISGNNSICIGETTTLTASGALPNTYYWATIGSGNPNVVTPSTTTTYTVTGQSTNGCYGSQAITVTVNPLPVFSVSATPSIVCSGQPINLNVLGGINYTWSPTAQNVNTIVVTPTISSSYTVNGTDINGCKGIASISVSVLPLPIITAGITNTNICASKSATIYAGGGVSYTWSPSGNNGFYEVVTPTVSSTYTVYGSGSNGCIGSKSILINVNPLPIINVVSTNSLLCIGQTATLNASGAVNYTWAPISAAGVSITAQPTITTTYTVLGSDANGCVGMASYIQNVSACTDIAHLANEEFVKIYPNPNVGEFTIVSSREMEIQIANELGQVFKKIKLSAVNNYSIIISDLPSGVYFASNKFFMKKIIVTK